MHQHNEITDVALLSVVRTAVQEAVEARDLAMGGVELAIAKALAAGRALRKAKAELPHGQFMQWVEEADLGVSYDTAGRWMKLAEKAEIHGDQIENAQTVRQAYILAGLMPESESSGGGGNGGGSSSFLTFLTRSSTHLQAQLAQRPLAQWGLEDRRVLRDRLAPLVEIFHQLEAA